MLYLIAALRADKFEPESFRLVSRASICLIRGDLESALVALNQALEHLDVTQSAYADVIAFRMFLGAFVDQNTSRWKSWQPGDVDLELGAPRIVSLCIRSNEKWHCGNLFDGLLLNQSAIQSAERDTPIWHLFAQLLLTKKLSDMHVSCQAAGGITIIQNLLDSSGLHAFEPLVPSLRSLLDLQAGRYDEALEKVDATMALSRERACTVGVKLALSVSAMAHLGRGAPDRAAEALAAYHASSTGYVLPDSGARAVVAEIVLVAADEGPRAAVELIRAKWRALATGSGCFIEDLTRPAWLIEIARRAGDTELAERTLGAIERLAGNNPGVPLLEKAAGHARTAFEGQPPTLPPVLDLGAAQRRRGRNARRHVVRRAESTSAVEAAPPTRPVPLAALSEREDEIARLVGRGMTNQQVAKQLGISPHTVNFHLRGIFRKLSITSRVKLGHLIAQVEQGRETPVIP
ncbi:MAG: helix-turn-helix transcriptional regulator [Actinophytocola sp.]|uniref:helix-turn-helix transcriptional regulator n=1 Tax=Actinophytocola sp. TaxID=1872138 RepID=UPI003D6BB906